MENETNAAPGGRTPSEQPAIGVPVRAAYMPSVSTALTVSDMRRASSVGEWLRLMQD